MSETAQYWSPWKPEVGQRVRTVINPECPGQYVIHGNWEAGSGLVGEIIKIDEYDSSGGHPYHMRLDAGARIWLSASELEPVDE